MHITAMPIVFEERCSEAIVLPHGRMVVAELEIRPTAPTVKDGVEGRDPLRLSAEVRWPGSDEFETVAETPWISEPAIYKLELPQAKAAAPETPLARQPVFRLRLGHEGRREPAFRLRVVGL